MLKDDAPTIWHQGFLKIDSASDADSWKIGLREDRDDAIELEKMEGMYVCTRLDELFQESARPHLP